MILPKGLRQAVAFFFSLFIIALPLAFVHGGTADNTVAINIPNPLGAGAPQDLPSFINKVITTLILPLGSMIAVVYILLAGFKMVTAQGNEKKLEEAKLAFIHAGIGTAILLGAYVISVVIQTTINSITSGS